MAEETEVLQALRTYATKAEEHALQTVRATQAHEAANQKLDETLAESRATRAAIDGLAERIGTLCQGIEAILSARAAKLAVLKEFWLPLLTKVLPVALGAGGIAWAILDKFFGK